MIKLRVAQLALIVFSFQMIEGLVHYGLVGTARTGLQTAATALSSLALVGLWMALMAGIVRWRTVRRHP